MTSPYTPPTRLPEGLPRDVIQGLVNQLITPTPPPGSQPAGPGPGGAPPMVQPSAVLAPQGALPAPGGPPAAAPGQPGPPQVPPGPPGPPGPGQQDEVQRGLTDEQGELLKTLMADPEARKQLQKIARKVSGEEKGGGQGKVDPARRLQLAQGWNARIGELAFQMNAARSQHPGASKASDEALLRIYYMTPIAPWSDKDEPFPIPIADIDEYADAVRLHLIQAGWDNPGKIEDQVVRECFPLRELLISAGRGWKARVEFTDQMLTLTERWLDRYGHLPTPDLKVLTATKAGKGDPESQERDTDSSAYPPGGYRSPALV